MRTIYVNVNVSDGVGAADWNDDQDTLPSFDASDARYRVNVPADVPTSSIADALDAFLGDYDLPDGWEVGPIS